MVGPHSNFGCNAGTRKALCCLVRPGPLVLHPQEEDRYVGATQIACLFTFNQRENEGGAAFAFKSCLLLLICLLKGCRLNEETECNVVSVNRSIHLIFGTNSFFFSEIFLFSSSF
ncbi:hypothetical protein ACE6H2_003091 [Prunus campanulata]